MKTLFIITLIFSSLILNAQDQTIKQRFIKATPKELDNFNLSDCYIDEYEELTNLSIEMLNSNIDSLEFKGEVSLSVIFNSLCEKLENNTIKKRNERVRNLLKIYEERQYYYQQKTNDYLKLAHYLCEGRYHYIYTRVIVSPIFIPFIIISILFLAFLLLNVIGIIKWKHKKKFYFIFLGLFLFFVIIFTLFKLTCNSYVTSDCFYFIYF